MKIGTSLGEGFEEVMLLNGMASQIHFYHANQGDLSDMHGEYTLFTPHSNPSMGYDIDFHCNTEQDGDLFIWRVGDDRWQNAKKEIDFVKKHYSKVVAFNCRTMLNMNTYGDPAFKDIAKTFDHVWHFEQDEGRILLEWAGYKPERIFEVVHPIPSHALGRYTKWKGDSCGQKRVAYGIYGGDVMRLFNITAPITDYLVAKERVTKVSYATDQNGYMQHTRFWLEDGKNNVEYVGRTPNLLDRVQVDAPRFACNVGIGRFHLELMAMGVPVFSGWHHPFPSMYVRPEYHLGRRDWKSLRNVAKMLLTDDDYRIKEGEDTMRWASRLAPMADAPRQSMADAIQRTMMS